MKVPSTTEIYLNFGRRLLLPVNPEEITITHPSNNKTYDILGIGEVVVPMSPGLTEAAWESFFPSQDADPYTTYEMPAKTIVSRLISAKNNREPGRLIITRSMLFDTNFRCIIEDFELIDKGGEPGDIYYRIRLKEYRDYSPETVDFIIPEEIHSTVEYTPPVITPTPETPTETKTVKTAKAAASTTKERPVENPVFKVGAKVRVNGLYFRTAAGASGGKPLTNYIGTIGRIDRTKTYPYYITGKGWVQESQLQIMQYATR